MSLLPSDFPGESGRISPMFLILGPCAFEGREHCVFMAESIAAITQRLDRLVIFKVSFDKANRTSRHSYRGQGIEEALETFDYVRSRMGIPVLTDVHEPWQCAVVAPHVDVLQTPAFLCRQTDLLQAAGATGLPVNVKKGQFLSAAEMQWALEKVRSSGGHPMACERGTFFGYNKLVNDFSGFATMRGLAPIVFDATHSVQEPGAANDRSGGNRRAALDIARAAISIGIDGLFLETHQAPDLAPSDGPTMVPLPELEQFLVECCELDAFSKAQLRARQFE